MFCFHNVVYLQHPPLKFSSVPRDIKRATSVTSMLRVPGGRPASTRTLNVVHSGELRSHFVEVDKDNNDCTSSKKALGDCYGGAARLSYQIIVNKPGISLFTGNIFGGHVWFRISGPNMVVDMLKTMAFDVMTLGILEFHNGPQGLIPLFSAPELKTKIVLCNVDFSHDHVLSKLPNLPTRSIIMTVDNLKVGIVGYISSSVRVMGQPGRLTDVTAFVVKYSGRFAYPDTATEKHGLDFDQDLGYPEKVTRSTDGKEVFIFASTDHFQLVGKFQITVDTHDMRVISAVGMPVILDLQAPEDKHTRDVLDKYTQHIQPLARKVIGTTKVYIENSHEICDTRECNGGNLLADAAFDYFSEVAVAGAWSQINAVVVNSGALSASFDEKTKSGEIRLEDVFQMFPYNDHYMFVTMRGTTLQAMMDHSGRRTPPFTKFLQVSDVSDDVVMQQYLMKRSPIMPMLDGRISFESGAQALGGPYWTRAAVPGLCTVAAIAVAAYT
ncbi:hypothetical protein HPB50_002498 [Hyalomma asiaticum]|uniref:Uncharacterized protein n=1 Tax=Hyalomma asiaticum TaxID=266040 RepID=A0ACB7SJZ7_HYAAI|nr:hypothetical protein HPB50_002498 [Hyalomma asiaticum]